MPKRVGKYLIHQTLGEGTFGKVKYAVNAETGERVAIKILDKERIQKQNMGAQIKKEISIMKMIKHDHVVKLYEVLASRTKIFIVLELVTGGELFDKIVTEGRFNEETARFYFRQLIRGMTYCQEQGVCHRDLKPENLLLDEHGNLKISDFGLSALYTGAAEGETSRVTLLHTTCGTPNYVAPEVLSDKGYDGRAADIWSCGVILYVLLAGFLPFDEPHMASLFRKIQKAEFVYPSWFSREARDLIDRILVPDPHERITAAEIMTHPWYNGDLPAVSGAAGQEGAGSSGDGGARAPAARGDRGGDEEEEGDSRRVVHTPSAQQVADAVNEGVAEEGPDDEEDTEPLSLNAFDVVNMFGGLALNRLLASDDDRRARATPQFISALPAGDIMERVTAAMRDLGCVPSVDERAFRITGEVLTKNGAVTVHVVLYRMTDSLHLVEVRRGRGDILAYSDIYMRLRESIADLATRESSGKLVAGGDGST